MKLTNKWIAGFVDGKGSFHIQQLKLNLFTVNGESQRLNESLNRILRHRFIISQDKTSQNVLYGIKEKLGCGTVHRAGGNMMAFQVSRVDHLEDIIVPFFQKHPLQTRKRETFRVFRESLRAYKAKCQPVSDEKRDENSAYDLSDDWFRGFIDAEGCFSVSLVKDYPRPQLVIGLQSEENQLMAELQRFLGCGTLKLKRDNGLVLQVVSQKDLELIIFPKLQTRGGLVQLKTSKRISYQRFRKIVRLIREKEHGVRKD